MNRYFPRITINFNIHQPFVQNTMQDSRGTPNLNLGGYGYGGVWITGNQQGVPLLFNISL